jgi:hypothetical protein
MKTTTQEDVLAKEGMARRSFLKFAGAGAIAAGVVATASSCQKHGGVVSDPTAIDLGTGDLAVLNYAYALPICKHNYRRKKLFNRHPRP